MKRVVTGYAIANVMVIPLTAWLGEQFGFVNIPFGILAVIMGLLFLPADSKSIGQPGKKIDWLGIELLTIALGSLPTFLEEGERDDWFHYSFIVTLRIVAASGLGLGKETNKLVCLGFTRDLE